MSEVTQLVPGWKIDEDGWFFRKSRPNDPKIKDRSDVGFDDSTFPNRPKDGLVYVREASHARDIDAGHLPPEPNRLRRRGEQNE
jgi:hypothetical protein